MGHKGGEIPCLVNLADKAGCRSSRLDLELVCLLLILPIPSPTTPLLPLEVNMLQILLMMIPVRLIGMPVSNCQCLLMEIMMPGMMPV